jgi:hypothetical protein
MLQTILALLNGLQAITAVCLSLLVYYNLRKWQVSRKLNRLGTIGPEIASSWPFGLSSVVQ